MQGTFGEGSGVEGGPESGRGRRREDLSGDCGLLYVVEGQASPVVGARGGGRVCDWDEVAGGDAGFEDEGGVGFGDALAIVYDGQGSEAAGGQGGGDEDADCAGVTGVAQELEEGVLDVGYRGGAAAGALGTREAGEAGAEVPVGSFHPAGALAGR